ncbi:hypothetical protein [Nocardia carnea]|uniref:hypothetical protein n=1 Tax=Nocardia carnea TaxID=37328 RepID=UPI002456C7DB|nr:hypothetical protein [Nocardia carnea]
MSKHQNADATVSEVEQMFRSYIAAFGTGDLDAKVNSFVSPYYDLRSTDGTPAQRIIDASNSHRYFTESREALIRMGWNKNTRIDQMKVWPLGKDLALLLAEFTRLDASGEPITAHSAGLDVKVRATHRVLYTLLRTGGTWKFTGYTALDDGYSGPE